MTKAEYELGMQVVKLLLKPGYIYAIGRDGELYAAEAKLPEPGETVALPPLYMPKEQVVDLEHDIAMGRDRYEN